MSEHHTILGGKVHVYKRPNSSSWQCATYLAGKNRVQQTKKIASRKQKNLLKAGICSCAVNSATAN